MDVRPTPNLLWRLFVLVGLGTLTVLSTNDQAWERFRAAVGDVVPRDAIRRVVVGTLGIHAAEAVVTAVRARRSGLAHPLRWGLSAFLWGFPVMGRLRRARRGPALTNDSADTSLAPAA